MVQLLSSYLFDEPTHLNSFYIRRSDSTKQFWTQPHVAGPRLADLPVYVLTSSRTFSAAEELTYNLKNTVRLEADRLLHQWAELLPLRMLPVVGDVFQLEGLDSFRVSFERDDSGSVIAILGHSLDGTTERHRRTTE